MAVNSNSQGTTNQSFRIGIDGPTIKQGTTTPSDSGSSNGDLYIQTGGGDNSQLWQRRRGVFRRQEQIFDHDYSVLTIINDNTNNNIYNTQIPGDYLQLDNIVLFKVFGFFLNNTGSPQETRIRLRYNGQNLFTDFTNISSSPNILSMEMEALLAANESTSSQKGKLKIVFSTQGQFTAPLIYSNSGSSTIDSTANNQLRIQWRFTNADSQLGIQRQLAYAQVLPAE